LLLTADIPITIVDVPVESGIGEVSVNFLAISSYGLDDCYYFLYTELLVLRWCELEVAGL